MESCSRLRRLWSSNGVKKLKAVVVKGRGSLPSVADPVRFKQMFEKVLDTLLTRYAMRAWGTTPGFWSTGYDQSSEPIRNWQDEWHDRKEFAHHEFELKVWKKRYWSDWGCPISCMKVSCVKNGDEILVTDGPDYEMGAYLGSNLGIFNPEHVALLSALADELGLCGIQTGNVMGFATELFEKKILTKDDVGYELR